MKSSISLAPGVAPRATASCPSQHSSYPVPIFSSSSQSLTSLMRCSVEVASLTEAERSEPRPAPAPGSSEAQADAPRTCDCRHGGKDLDQPGDRVEVEAEPALSVADHLVGSGQPLRDRLLVTHHDERALAVATDDEGRRAAEVAPVAAEVVDVIGAEDDRAIDLLVVHPVAQALEPVGRSRRRDGHGASLRAGGGRAREYVILAAQFRISRFDFKS